MKLATIAAFFFMGAAQAAPLPQHPDVNPDLLAKMIEDSVLIYCKEEKCVRMDNGEKWPEEKSRLAKDGYAVVFPKENYTYEEMLSMQQPLAEYYQTYLEMKADVEQ